MLSRNDKFTLFIILASAFFIKIILALSFNQQLRSDSLDYVRLAGELLQGKYTLDGKPTAYVGCGYPLFLAAIFSIFGESQFFIKLIQSIMEIATGYFFFRISLNYFNVKYSLLSLALFCFFPSNILYSQTVLSEPLFGFIFCIILYLCLKNNFPAGIFLTGLLCGFAVLIRTAFLPGALLIPLYLILKRRTLWPGKNLSPLLKTVSMFSIGFFLFIAPWSIRNKIEVGTFSLGTTAGVNFWAGSNPDATGTYTESMSEEFAKYNDEAIRDRDFFKRGIDYAISNPLNYLILGVKKIGYLFSSERMILIYFADSKPGQTSTEVYKSVDLWLMLLVNIPYFLIMLSGTWGLLMLNKKRFFIYGYILMWMMTVFFFIALARYHYVLIPFFVLGTVNLILQGKVMIKNLSLLKKATAAGFNLFLISVWAAEFYLLIKK